jgi:hypothetical protein
MLYAQLEYVEMWSFVFAKENWPFKGKTISVFKLSEYFVVIQLKMFHQIL